MSSFPFLDANYCNIVLVTVILMTLALVLSSSSSSPLLSPLCRIFTIIYLKQINISRVCNVAAVLYLQLMLHVMLFFPVKYVLYFHIGTFHRERERGGERECMRACGGLFFIVP